MTMMPMIIMMSGISQLTTARGHSGEYLMVKEARPRWIGKLILAVCGAPAKSANRIRTLLFLSFSTTVASVAYPLACSIYPLAAINKHHQQDTTKQKSQKTGDMIYLGGNSRFDLLCWLPSWSYLKLMLTHLCRETAAKKCSFLSPCGIAAQLAPAPDNTTCGLFERCHKPYILLPSHFVINR